MPYQAEIVKTITPPEGVTISLVGKRITVKGPKGSITKDFSHADIIIEMQGKDIVIKSQFPKKKQKALIGTIASHVNNMITGVTKGFEYRMKIVYAHFPIKVETSKDTVTINNLYGRRAPIKVKIVGEKTQVKVDGDDVVVTGINKEEVGQTCANIQESTRLRGKRRTSPKTFMDGIYVFKRSVLAE